MRLGQLYRARGDVKQAAEHLRIAAAMARTPEHAPSSLLVSMPRLTNSIRLPPD
jgi:lipopolysaccharide biosynthesis regulator YciM